MILRPAMRQMILLGVRAPVVSRPVWRVPALPVRFIRMKKIDPPRLVKSDDDDEGDDDEDDEDEDEDDDALQEVHDSDTTEEEEHPDSVREWSDDSTTTDSDDEWLTENEDDDDEDEDDIDDDDSDEDEDVFSSDSDSESESESDASEIESEVDKNGVKFADMFQEGDEAWEKKFLGPFIEKKYAKAREHFMPALAKEELRCRKKFIRLTSRKQDSRKKPRSEQKHNIKLYRQRIQKIAELRASMEDARLASRDDIKSDIDSDEDGLRNQLNPNAFSSRATSSNSGSSRRKKSVSVDDSELDEEEAETVRLQSRLRKVNRGEIKISKQEKETLIESCRNAAPLWYDAAGRPVYVPIGYQEGMSDEDEYQENDRKGKKNVRNSKISNSKKHKDIYDASSVVEPLNLPKNKELGKLTGGVSVDEPMQLKELDLKETFMRSRGPGGQNVNKVNSCVELVHTPTGTRVKCMQSRHQAVNRKLARKIMEERLAELFESKETTATRKTNKIRRQKSRRMRRLTQPPAGLDAFLKSRRMEA